MKPRLEVVALVLVAVGSPRAPQLAASLRRIHVRACPGMRNLGDWRAEPSLNGGPEPTATA